MQRIVIGAVLSALVALAGAPGVHGAGYSVWRASLSGPALHGGATLTERSGAPVRLAVTVDGALPGSRPVMEIVGAACGHAGAVIGAVRIPAAGAAGRTSGVELLSVVQTQVFNGWIAQRRAVSVHVVAQVPAPSQTCGNLPGPTPPPPPPPPSSGLLVPTVWTPTELASGYSLGRADARVVVEVWEDFQCPYCGQFTQAVEPRLVATYVETGKVRFVFRDLAFLGPDSTRAAVAADLAADQGKFWPYHDYLYANQPAENSGGFSVARLDAIADAVGLDRVTFDAGLAPDAAAARFAQIQASSQPEAARLGVQGTPTVVVNGTPQLNWTWSAVQQAIEAALAMQ